MTSKTLHEKIWAGSLPLCITVNPVECRTYDTSLPYFVQTPRLSYLPALLPDVTAFFKSSLINADVKPHEGWFSFEDVPLKLNYPVGLLFDLFAGSVAEQNGGSGDEGSQDHDNNNGERSHDIGSEQLSLTRDKKDFASAQATLPWKIVLHFTDWPYDHLSPLDAELKLPYDAFLNAVKEASFLRNGSSKVIMAMSTDDTLKLWRAVQQCDITTFDSVYHKLLNPADGEPVRNVPLKVYLPVASKDVAKAESGAGAPTDKIQRGTLRVVQGLVPTMISSRDAQTIGTALHSLLPTVFPSRRSYIHAEAVLHGAIVPTAAPLTELMRQAVYGDGFLHIAVKMQS